MRQPLPLSLFLLAFAAAPLASQSEAGTKAPLRLAIIGASVSAGFVDGPLSGGATDNRTMPLQRVVRAWLADLDAKVSTRADMMLFLAPETKGREQVERTVKEAPDLVVALDFLFWFGYGRVDAGKDGEADARLLRLQEGLELLQQFHCPVIAGDLPDMRGAAARMISAAQIPSPEVLVVLNERIAKWTKDHASVRLFPLRQLVSDMKEKGIALPLAGGALPTPPGSLLQGDRLHANRLGMAWLGFLLQDHVRAALPGAGAEKLPRWKLEQFIETTGAEDDLADLRAGASAKAAGNGKE